MISIAEPLVDNFRLRARQHIANESGSAGYIIFGAGNNGIASSTSSNGEREFLLRDAYATQWQRGLAGNAFLAEKVSGTWNGTGGTFTLANMQADNEHLMTFCTSCAADLAWSVQGIGTIASRATETTLQAMPKTVFFGSGDSVSLGRGGDQVIDFILAQKFEDDDEYTPAIGAEETGGGGMRLIIIFWWW
jgi:hypothetical protein